MKDLLTANDSSNSTQLALLKTHFPQCFDKNGAFMPHKLQEIVESSGVALSREGYSLNWLGKSYARLLANENVRTLLKANTAHNDLAENKDSQNILIKGDNLEVLKHLVGAYSERVKMIYIDPPYNTGSDGFVYADDRKFTVEQLTHLAGIGEDEARRILEFTSSKSNSHSAWLTFMYPRLYIARQLLRDDGVIFISIDDNEQAQLKLLCDEVFGEENFLTCVAVKLSEATGVKMAHVGSRIPKLKEYLISYKKGKDVKLNPSLIAKSGWDYEYKTVCLGLNKEKLGLIKEILADDSRTNEDVEKIAEMLLKLSFDSAASVCMAETSKELTDEWLFDNAYRMLQFVSMSGGALEIAREAKQKLKILPPAFLIQTPNNKAYLIKSDFNQESNLPRCKILFADQYLQINTGDFWSDIKTTGLDNEGGVPFKNGKKPLKMIKRCIDLATSPKDLILDFFAGSGTTAHAVMQLNAEDGGNRQFICVQIDEPTDPKSEAHKAAGYETIYDITCERIKRAATKIKTDYPDAACDLGFKQFETIPVFDGYLDEIEELTPTTELFKADFLSTAQLHDLMLTWAVMDGILLTQPLVALDLGGYTAYTDKREGGKIIYFMASGLNLDHVITLLEKLDSDPTFTARHWVAFGYVLDSKAQREISEATHYRDRKGTEIIWDVRF
ncbi:MAG: DNA methyltransferase [Formosimonas sp.]